MSGDNVSVMQAVLVLNPLRRQKHSREVISCWTKPFYCLADFITVRKVTMIQLYVTKGKKVVYLFVKVKRFKEKCVSTDRENFVHCHQVVTHCGNCWVSLHY